mgnify:CR=1 FL=1
MEGGAPIDPTADPSAPQGVNLDENGNPIESEPIPSNISEEMLESMKKVWSVFDMKEDDKVTTDELATIMRALDINVDREEKLEEIRKAIDPSDTGIFNYASLNSVMEE